MAPEHQNVNLELTYDEAYEILNRCLLATGEDNKPFRDALRKLAWAIERSHSEEKHAA